MGTKFWCGAAMLASLAASMGAAGAADLAVKAPVYKAPPPPVILSDWSGFYLGVNGGGGWSDASVNQPGTSHIKGSGGLGGGQLGYNWQFGTFVVGVEADFDGADISKTTLGTAVKTDELGTIRGRAGYTILPNLLGYGTAGFAYGRTTVSNIGVNNAVDIAENGWVAGGGLEYKVWGPLIARAEYLHYGFDNANFGGEKLKNDIDVVRGGLSYKF